MAHEDVFLVDEFMEKNPGVSYSQAVKALAQQEKLMSSAKSLVSKEANAAPMTEGGSTTTAPEKSLVEKTFGITLPNIKPQDNQKSFRIPGTFAMHANSKTGEPESKMMDILTAAAPYISPVGRGTNVLRTAAKAFLPTAFGLKEAFSPGTKGDAAENAVGTAANAARTFAGARVPGLNPVAQAAGAMGLEQFAGNAAKQTADKGIANVDLSDSLKSGVLGLLTGGLGTYGVRGAAKNATQQLEDTMSGPFKEMDAYGAAKPFNEVRTALSGYLKAPPSFLAKAGFDTATVRQFRANPNNTIDGLLDKALGFKGTDTVLINSANNTLGKFVDLMASNPAAQKEIKEKTGEYLITKFLNPATSSKNNLTLALRELEKGGKSAFDKILSSGEKQALFSAIDNVKTIARTERMRDMDISMTNNGSLRLWLGDKIYLLTPSHMATHILEQAKKPDAGPAFSGLAEHIRSLKRNPLAGGRLTRASTEFLEKELLGIGAEPISVEQGMGPLKPEHPGFFKPPSL